MKYEGKLYAKVGGRYVSTDKTGKDWDELYKQSKLLEQVKQEIKNIELILSDWEEEYKHLSNHIDNHDECIHLFDEIRKYSNYKTALEQVVNGFPIEVGSY